MKKSTVTKKKKQAIKQQNDLELAFPEFVKSGGKKSISVASRKQKGRNLQKHVVQKILQTFPELTKNDVRSTSMGAGGRDVTLSESGLHVFPYAVECKSRNAIAIYKDYEQAGTHCEKDELPLLVIKQNHSEPLAVVSLEHFMELVHANQKKN